MKFNFITDELCVAARYCLAEDMPFAIAYLPCEDRARFYSSKHIVYADTLVNGFIISNFGKVANSLPIVIPEDFSSDILASKYVCKDHDSTVDLSITSTDKSVYFEGVDNVIRKLQGREAKVVISRIEVLPSVKDCMRVADEYFSKYPDCFRAIYFTPQTGLWIVATPEVLVNYDYESSRFDTMSLAGTRRVSSCSWDEKNLKEHQLVTDYIENCLSTSGLVPVVSEPENIGFGNIEHLCNRISAVGRINPIAMASRLSPTPAVCGWPVDEAFAVINETERHSRDCYGGYVGVNDTTNCLLYVNLRCCRVLSIYSADQKYVLYAGGGINAMSIATDEWKESEAKMCTLKMIIKQ